MFRNALVGVDFRQGGRDAIALAAQLVDRDSTIALSHVYAGRFMPSHAVAPGVVREERERAETELRAARAEAGIDAELIVTQGPTPGRVLHELAEERDCDLLVLGSCHRGVLGRAMLGDDTRASTDGAPCAVAVAPGGYDERAAAIATIGVAYNGSAESRAALELARRLAGPLHAQIRALHIISLSPYDYSTVGAVLLDEINKRVDDADARMKSLTGVDGRAEYGLPDSDLEAFGAEVDLLIVGSRGYGPWGRLVHGSTSAQLARHSRGPLLIVPRLVPQKAADEELEETPSGVGA